MSISSAARGSVFALSLVTSALAADPISLIPRPQSLVRHEGLFEVTEKTAVDVSDDSGGPSSSARFLLKSTVGRDLPVADSNAASIHLRVDSTQAGVLGDEGYTLIATPSGLTISAATSAGMFYGVQTLRQLLPIEAYAHPDQFHGALAVPCVEITDRPRFTYRGMHLDCVRHFFPKDFVLKFIDLEAAHKFNTFHWHLTDDQGWRIQILKYPKLTEVGAWRKETVIGHPSSTQPMTFDGTPTGGFYTQDDIREVVAYAAARHITVIPEIEMPGHAHAAIAAYPEFGTDGQPTEVATTWGNVAAFNVDDSTIRFCENILDEVMGLFPSKYIHCGGDEVNLRKWKQSPRMQAKAKELGIAPDKDEKDTTAEKQLQAYFVEHIDSYLTRKGRQMIGWDEILYGHLAPGATVMSWRGIKGGVEAAEAGHDVIMTPGEFCYFDHYQTRDIAHEPLAIGGFLPLPGVYRFNPIPPTLSPEQAKHILGGQANTWAEFIKTSDRVEYMDWPRACAMAEVLWSPTGGDYANFYDRLMPHLDRLKAMKVNYRTPREEDTPKAAATMRAEDY